MYHAALLSNGAGIVYNDFGVVEYQSGGADGP